jgi:hypothetical protein
VSSGGESTPSIQGTPVVTLQDLLNQGYIPIASEADLLAINSTAEHDFATGTAFFLSTNGGLDLNYVLVTDVAFTTPLTNAVIADGIFNGPNHFTGIFNGFGYSISGLEITNSTANNRVGLFGSISGASIKNLTLSAFSVTSTASSANNERLGLLAGQASGNTAITQILITGSTISAQSGNKGRNLPQGGAGGLIGYVDYFFVSSVLTISGIYANTNIELTGESTVGGLIGSVSWTQLSSSDPQPSTPPPYIYLENIIYEGDIKQTQQFSLMGGIIGTYRAPTNSPDRGRLILNNVLYSGTILNSNDIDESTGGIVGILNNQLNVEMNQVIFDGIITGTARHIGGIIGRITTQNSNNEMSLEIHDSAVFGQLSTTIFPTSGNNIFVGAIIGRDETNTPADKTDITFTSIIVSSEFLGMTIPPATGTGTVHAFNRSPNNITYSGIVFLERGSLKDFSSSGNDMILPSTSTILQDIQTFKDFNWSIELKSDDTNDSIWLIDPNTNNGYPYLRAFRHLFED